MPTGYTAGIIDGKIKTFDQFAKNCMRAFGATIHMRDEPLDREYEPREPSSYHSDKIQDIKNEIKKLESMSDEEVEQFATDELRSEIKERNERLKKSRDTEKKLKRMLEDVREWNPPTIEHENFKGFMIQQLKETLKFDGVSDWQTKELRKCEEKITSIFGRFERRDRIEKLNKDLKYHEEEHEKEVQRCEEANEWVKKLIESL